MLGLVGFLLATAGCDAVLNPAFFRLLDPEGATSTINNAPGHVVISFANKTEFDDRVVEFLEDPARGGLTFTQAEKDSLRPRIRARVRVTFAGGEDTVIEFISGTPGIVESDFSGLTVTDLNQNDLDRAVVVCDVEGVELSLTNVEVFVPMVTRVWTLVQFEFTSSFITSFSIDPRFVSLRQDVVNEEGDTLITRNVSLRDIPAPVDRPICGTVVSIEMTGVFGVPFFRGSLFAGYLDEDNLQEGIVGGRYKFVVSVR